MTTDQETYSVVTTALMEVMRDEEPNAYYKAAGIETCAQSFMTGRFNEAVAYYVEHIHPMLAGKSHSQVLILAGIILADAMVTMSPDETYESGEPPIGNIEAMRGAGEVGRAVGIFCAILLDHARSEVRKMEEAEKGK